MASLWCQLDRFTDASASDPFYCLQKMDGRYTIFTKTMRDGWAEWHVDALHYWYDEEYMQEWDIIDDISSKILGMLEPEMQSELLQKRMFTLYPYTSHGPVFESWASSVNIAAHFFNYFTRCTQEESQLPWPHPAFEVIGTILQTRCGDEPLAKKALELMDSLIPEDLTASSTGSEPESASYVCPIPNCDRTYRRKGDLKQHVMAKHENSEIAANISPARSSKEGKPFPCPEESCPSGYQRQADLMRHQKKKH